MITRSKGVFDRSWRHISDVNGIARLGMKKVLLMPEESCKKQHAKGSNVSSHSNKTPSATSFLSVAYLE
jgi:hypothetical protein